MVKLKQEMNEFAKKFILDVYNRCDRAGISLDENYNIWYTYLERKMVIPASEIDKYYQAYKMSRQLRDDAIARATNHVRKLIDKRREQ